MRDYNSINGPVAEQVQKLKAATSRRKMRGWFPLEGDDDRVRRVIRRIRDARQGETVELYTADLGAVLNVLVGDVKPPEEFADGE